MKILELKDIRFPIFPIRKHLKLWDEDNITFIETEHQTYVLDNKNLAGDFPKRRLSMVKSENYKLYDLNAITTLRGLIQYKSTTYLYIDYNGDIFKYKKKKYFPVSYRQIYHCCPIEGQGYLLKIEGIDNPTIIPAFMYNWGHKWAKVVNGPFGPVVLELCEWPSSNTRMMI